MRERVELFGNSDSDGGETWHLEGEQPGADADMALAVWRWSPRGPREETSSEQLHMQEEGFG